MPCSVPSSPGRPWQDVERDVRLERLHHGRDVAANIDLGDAIAFLLERLGAGLAGCQADLALRGPASHQNSDMFR